MPFKADRDLYVSLDGERLCGPEEPGGARLIAVKGTDVSDRDAEKYGLKGPKGTEDAPPATSRRSAARQGAERE